MTEDQVNESIRDFLFRVVAGHKDVLQGLITSVDPKDLLVLSAFLLAVIETQLENATEAFDQELRPFFSSIYPGLIAAMEEKTGPAEGLVLIIPDPAPEEAKVIL